MSINSSVSPDLRTALEALIADWEYCAESDCDYDDARRHHARQLRALLVSHPPSPPPDELSFLRESLELFFGAIVQQYGTNDHAWLVRNARDTLKTLKQLPSPPGAGWRDIASYDYKKGEHVLVWNGYRRALGWFKNYRDGSSGWHRQNLIGEPLGLRDLDPDTHYWPLPSAPREESST